uniref:hypothetical protein n=1 Tax=Streptomyces corallincola TaxID=2851888 RepID=UPI001FE8F85C|nr:hypothetical protein [Streptomyces corallincola]
MLTCRRWLPSLVVLPGPSYLVPPAEAAELSRSGFEIRTLAGAGHTLHRNDFECFVAVLDGWL